jgi:hypothetical protein
MFDRRALDRLAGRGVDDESAQEQRRARSTFRDIAAQGFVRDVVRAFRLLGRQHAGHRTGGDGRRAGALGGFDLQCGRADRCRQKSAKTYERAASSESGIIHLENLRS